jgi:hypothetical protein
MELLVVNDDDDAAKSRSRPCTNRSQRNDRLVNVVGAAVHAFTAMRNDALESNMVTRNDFTTATTTNQIQLLVGRVFFVLLFITNVSVDKF